MYHNNIDLTELPWELSEVIYANCLPQCLTWIYFQQKQNHKCMQMSEAFLLLLLFC